MMDNRYANLQRDQSLGSLIRDLRKGRSLSLSACALEAGISPSYLSRLERGHRRPPVDVLTRLADVLEVSPLSLLGAAGILSAHTLKDLGVPPYGVDPGEWKDALQELSEADWQEIHALIRTKLDRYRALNPHPRSRLTKTDT